VVEFWLSVMANFVKDGGAILGYGGAIFCPVCQIFGFPPWSAIDNITYNQLMC